MYIRALRWMQDPLVGVIAVAGTALAPLESWVAQYLCYRQYHAGSCAHSQNIWINLWLLHTEYTGYGLETDPSRGVRIKPEEFWVRGI